MIDKLIEDILESTELAMKSEGIDLDQISRVIDTVSDAICNNADLDVEMYYIVCGNVVDGIHKIIGPFESADHATSYMEDSDEEWRLATGGLPE